MVLSAPVKNTVKAKNEIRRAACGHIHSRVYDRRLALLCRHRHRASAAEGGIHAQSCERQMSDAAQTRDWLTAFIEASVWDGLLDEAEAILAAHPEIASSSIHAAAILGDDATVRRFLALEPAKATTKGGPRDWDALTHLCFSK